MLHFLEVRGFDVGLLHMMCALIVTGTEVCVHTEDMRFLQYQQFLLPVSLSSSLRVQLQVTLKRCTLHVVYKLPKIDQGLHSSTKTNFSGLLSASSAITCFGWQQPRQGACSSLRGCSHGGLDLLSNPP